MSGRKTEGVTIQRICIESKNTEPQAASETKTLIVLLGDEIKNEKEIGV